MDSWLTPPRPALHPVQGEWSSELDWVPDDWPPEGRVTEMCACATNWDGSVTTMLCPIHAQQDPCWTLARVTGKRRKGAVRRGTCTHCGWRHP
jgi:hypothetical protein